MTQVTYRANLSAAIFPLSLAQTGRSVIIPGPDNNYDRRVDPEGEQKDAGIPQAIYLENILPLSNGYQSIGHTEYIDFLGTYGFQYLTHTKFYLNDKQYIAYFGQEPSSGPYRCLFETGASRFESTSGYDATVGAVYTTYAGQTIAEARGQCFFVFPFSTTLFELIQLVGDIDINPIATSGITWTDIVGICGAFNYLIAVKNDGTVQWSSTTTPTDFTPSLVNGAGSATPFGAIRGVTGVHSHPTGFIVTSQAQSFIAQYTGNSRYPWKFSLIKGAGPGLKVVNAEESDTYFGVDEVGNFYTIQGDKATLIAPELSSWLQQSPYLDSYNKTTNVFSSVAGTYARAKISMVDDRYLACSYDVGPDDVFNGVIIYDILLRRYGNIKYAHNDIIPGVGSVVLVDTGNSVSEIYNFRWQDSYTHDSVLALGKFQYARSRNLTIHEMAIEGDLQSVTTALIPSMNGRTFDTAVIPDVTATSSSLLELACRTEAKNHTLVIKGKFAVTTVELTFSLGGGR